MTPPVQNGLLGDLNTETELSNKKDELDYTTYGPYPIKDKTFEKLFDDVWKLKVEQAKKRVAKLKSKDQKKTQDLTKKTKKKHKVDIKEEIT